MRHPALPSNPIRSAARLAGSAAIKQLKPAPATSSSPAVGSIEVDVNVQQLAGAVPQDFLGISLEWPGIEYYAGKGNAAAWSNVLGVLGPGAIIRVGGSSQDKLTEVSTGGLALCCLLSLDNVAGALCMLCKVDCAGVVMTPLQRR
jgi:hypothetical protein